MRGGRAAGRSRHGALRNRIVSSACLRAPLDGSRLDAAPEAAKAVRGGRRRRSRRRGGASYGGGPIEFKRRFRA
eukprot:6227419-Prymnesium_polylepis.1